MGEDGWCRHRRIAVPPPALSLRVRPGKGARGGRGVHRAGPGPRGGGTGAHVSEPGGRRGRGGRGPYRRRGLPPGARHPPRRDRGAPGGGGTIARRHLVHQPGALRPFRPHPALHRRGDRGRRGPRRVGHGRSEPHRGRAGLRQARGKRDRGPLRRPGGGRPPAERGLREARADRPAVRHVEDGRIPRREGGLAGRHVEVDHRGGRAGRRPPAARGRRRHPGGSGHGPRR